MLKEGNDITINQLRMLWVMLLEMLFHKLERFLIHGFKASRTTYFFISKDGIGLFIMEVFEIDKEIDFASMRIFS